VARSGSISPTFLSKIVQTLAKAGVLTTRRGVGGGISMAVPAEEVSLLTVIEAIEGPLALNECVSPQPECKQIPTCAAFPYMSEAQLALRRVLDVSIAEMLARLDGAPERIERLAPTKAEPNRRPLESATIAEAARVEHARRDQDRTDDASWPT
jgi:Rrf2 family protein